MAIDFVAVCSSLGVGSILTMIVQKFLSRKNDKLDIQEKQMQVANKLIDSLEAKLDVYINITEKATEDIATLQSTLGRIYPFTCNKDCQDRQLIDSSEINACVTINNKGSAD